MRLHFPGRQLACHWAMITGQPPTSQSSIDSAQVVLFYVKLYFRSGVYAFCRDVPMQCLVFVGYVIKMCNKRTTVHRMYTGFFTTLYLRDCHDANSKLLNNFIITELQWNLWNKDTAGPCKSVLISEVSLIRRFPYVRIGNNSGPWILVRIVEVSVIGEVRFQRFHCRLDLWNSWVCDEWFLPAQIHWTVSWYFMCLGEEWFILRKTALL